MTAIATYQAEIVRLDEQLQAAREENEQLKLMATTELYEAKECNIALSRENAELKAAMGECSDYFHDFIETDERETELAKGCRAAPNRPAAVPEVVEGRGEGVISLNDFCGLGIAFIAGAGLMAVVDARIYGRMMDQILKSLNEWLDSARGANK